ncbi:MAG TPA: hypothetical protein VMW16_11845 [Sedimentisphaerales bacterium]|nr:hypothetical protein [Sedimentisphaerales bacterium]
MSKSAKLVSCGTALCLLLAAAAAGQEKKAACLVRVVDSKAQPVAGAEVVAYENFYDYADGRIRTKLLAREKTDEHGAVSFSLAIEKDRDVYVVAGKRGLAMGWDLFAPEVTIVLGEPFVLAGTVVDETGRTVAGAKVRVLLEGSHVRRIANRQPGLPQEWFRMVADAEGGFVFEAIPGDAGADFFVEAAGKASCYTFMASDLMPGMRFAAGRRDIRIVLEPEAKIEGRVVDEAGGGVAGVRLLARPDKGVGNYYCTDSILSRAGGHFCFTGLPAGKYSVQVVSPWGRTAEWVGEDVEVVANAGQTADGVTVKVEKGVVVEVVVRDADTKRGIPDAGVTLNKRARFGRHSCLYEYVKTDTDGRARLRAPRGDCEIWAAGEGYSFSRQSCLIEEVTSPLELPLVREPSISGTVCDEKGKPVSGARVDILPRGSGAVRTDAAGRFNLAYYGADTAEQRYVLAQHEERNLAALVQIKDVSGPMDVTLKPGLILAGRATEPNCAPVAAARIQLGAFLPGWLTRIGNEVISDAEGKYEIRAVPPQQEDVKYRLEISALGYGPVELKRVLTSDSSEGRVELEPLILRRAHVSVSGIVVDADGKPAGDVPIFLTGPRGSHTAGQPSRHAVTDNKGEFSIERVCPGPLRLQAGMGGRENEPGFLDAEGGDQNLKVILGQRLVHTRHVSLVGKSLPDLKDLNVELSPADANNKMILVCFWDMNQRPSRHCIRQLAKRAEELKEKGAIAAAVQASKVDEKELSDWMKKLNVPFPSGMIEGDEEKIRFAWGVRSLPWLILTDRQSIVAAEGFSLSELDEKLRQTNRE